MLMKITLGLTSSLGLALCFSGTVFAQSLVIGDGGAQECYYSVKHGDMGRASTIKKCKIALKDPHLSKKDEAATHVNLGILLMRSKKYAEARAQYKKAIDMWPKLSEAYINYAANLIYMGDFDAAIEASNQGIALGTKKMPEALFNRAMAYDNLRRYNEAYADLKKALVLRPNWKPVLRAIDNYEIVHKVDQPGLDIISNPKNKNDPLN